MKSICVTGYPRTWTNFYGGAIENFKNGEIVILYSSRQSHIIWCVKQIRKVFDRGNGSVFVDLY